MSDDESTSKQDDRQDESAAKIVFLENIPKHPQNDVIPQKILDAMYVTFYLRIVTFFVSLRYE